jgi:hypothetical protein
MAFEIQDFKRHYIKEGSYRGLFNVARSDEENDNPRYYAFYNEDGSYVIQQITTSGTTKIYKYYAHKSTGGDLDTDFTNRSSLTYVEYYQLFPNG